MHDLAVTSQPPTTAQASQANPCCLSRDSRSIAPELKPSGGNLQNCVSGWPRSLSKPTAARHAWLSRKAPSIPNDKELLIFSNQITPHPGCYHNIIIVREIAVQHYHSRTRSRRCADASPPENKGGPGQRVAKHNVEDTTGVTSAQLAEESRPLPLGCAALSLNKFLERLSMECVA
jgi:hypothetical protein